MFQLEFVILILIFRANPWAYDLSNNNNNNDQMSRKSSELNERVGDLLEDEFGEHYNFSQERGIYLMRIAFNFNQMRHVISRVNSQLLQFLNLHFDMISSIHSVLPL